VAGLFQVVESLLRSPSMTKRLRTVTDAAVKTASRVGVPLRRWSGKMRGRSVPRVLRRTTGDPIDVASGEVIMHQTDVELAGVLPLVLERTHVSSYRQGGLFGISWASTLDQRLEVDGRGACFASADGMVLTYPPPASTGTAVLPYEGPRWPLAHTGAGYAITDPVLGRTLHFQSPLPLEGSGQSWPLTAVVDRNGNRIDFVYTEDGMLSEVSHRGGHRIGVDREDGRVVALRLLSGTDNGRSNGQILISYGYTDNGHLAEVTNSSGKSLRFHYDGEGRLTGWIDRNDEWYRYTYDDSGRCVRGTGSGGALNVSLSYADKATVTTDSLGSSTTYHFNELGQVVTQIDPLGHMTRSEWDRYDRLLSGTDQLGRTTRYDYDEAGNLIAVTSPDRSRTTIAYDGLGLPIRVTEPGGAVWRQRFDERGNLIAITDPLDATSRYTYDEHGHLTAVTDPLGHTTRICTNTVGLPIAVTDPVGSLTRYARDAFGRVTAVTDSVGGITRFGWTTEGNRDWRTLPTGVTERWRYDAEGNLVEYVDAGGRTVRTEYTHFDLPAAQITADGARLEFDYDTQLRLTSVRNPQGLVWRYSYDRAGHLISEVDFDGRQFTYDHDSAGQPSSRTDGAGRTTRLVRDTLGRVIEKHNADGVTRFEYDVAGRLTGAANAGAHVRLTLDALGRIVAETVNGRTLSSTYDAAGRRIVRRTPAGAEATWGYDPAGRPSTLATAGQSMRFTYDPANREIERTVNADIALTQQWDADHRLTAQTLRKMPQTSIAGRDRSIQHRTYGYRTDGELVAVGDIHSGLKNLTLDATGHVTEVNGHDWVERYRYDTAGNLTDGIWPTSPHDVNTVGTREYARMLIRRAGGVGYEHDSHGRVTSKRDRTPSGTSHEWRYTWDADDRLSSVVTPDGQRWRYLYDPFGRRIAKQGFYENGADAGRIDFTWDRFTLVEQSGDGEDGPVSTTWDYQPGGIGAVAQTERTSVRDAPQQWIDQRFYAIVTDTVGAPVEMVDTNGHLVWKPQVTLWGNHVPVETDRAYCPLRFPGQYHDPETGLNYNVHRYYDPTTARYQTADPLGLTPQPNPYAYVHNPTRWVDPLGLSPYLVSNRKPELLGREIAYSSNIPIIIEGTAPFSSTLQHINGLPRGEKWTFRWVVTEDGSLRMTIPGTGTSHAVMTNGGPVQAGGMADIGPGFNSETGDPTLVAFRFTNETGHFVPPRALAKTFLDVGTTAFERNGVHVSRKINFGGI
jgi:RHS repeat-associated protein